MENIKNIELYYNLFNKINPYSVLHPHRGFLEFLKIAHFINIFLFIA